MNIRDIEPAVTTLFKKSSPWFTGIEKEPWATLVKPRDIFKLWLLPQVVHKPYACGKQFR